MNIEPGARIGEYEIVSRLGSGGFGDVYRARDSRLGREVALKILNETAAADDSAVVRFQLEARAASSLNHPNILTIYEIGSVSMGDHERNFIASELIEGRTLRTLMREGARFESLFETFIQIAEGLSKAHAADIVHRDLKPENIMVSDDGYAKILDFGLAKLLPQSVESSPDDATVARHLTAPGLAIGTIAYMAPEQIRGQDIDARCDVFALGCILYETATGEHPFDTGRSSVNTLERILTSEPPLLSRLHELAPAPLQGIVRRCLARDRGKRYASARELLADLRQMQRSLERHRAPRSVRLEQLTFAREVEQFPALSPDGDRLVFCRDVAGLRHLFLLERKSGAETQLTDGEHDHIQPAWSPDGQQLLFVRSDAPGNRVGLSDVFGWNSGGSIWRYDLTSRQQILLLTDAFNPAWSADGTRIAFDASWGGARRIWSAHARGQNRQQLTSDTSEAIAHVRPRWSPDGSKIVFQNIEGTKVDIRLADVRTGELLGITDDPVIDVHPVWSFHGDAILFSSYRGGGINIWQAPVDDEGRPAGPLEQLTTGAGQDIEIDVPRSADRLVFTAVRQNSEIWRLPVSEEGEPTGRPEQVIATTRESSRGAVSPDGSRIAFSSDRTGTMNLWLLDLTRNSVTQLSRGAGGDYQACWSPDGAAVVFFSGRAGGLDIWRVEVGTRELERLTFGEGININPFVSPDGRLIAFHSDRDGRFEVWVMNFDGSNARALTTCGASGHFMRWTPDGAHILFRRGSGEPRLMRVALDGSESVEMPPIAGGAHISLSPDGKRLMDVINHQELWVSPLENGSPRTIFAFDDPDVRIDYPVWSPDGAAVIFDRLRPQGGDIWMLEFH